MFDLKQRRIELGLTMLEVAKLVGVSEATISRYESGNIKNMRKDRIAKYASALKVPPSTFLELEDKSESRLTATDIRANTKPVPLVGRVAAGLSCHAEDNIEGYILTDCEFLHEGYDYFWLTVKGDSMYPEFQDGDRVLIREQSTLDCECYAVVRIDGEDGVIKRVRIEDERIILTSINPYYPPRIFECEEMNRIAIVGLVLKIERVFSPIL